MLDFCQRTPYSYHSFDTPQCGPALLPIYNMAKRGINASVSCQTEMNEVSDSFPPLPVFP